jgi:hypothetical protein
MRKSKVLEPLIQLDDWGLRPISHGYFPKMERLAKPSRSMQSKSNDAPK